MTEVNAQKIELPPAYQALACIKCGLNLQPRVGYVPYHACALQHGSDEHLHASCQGCGYTEARPIHG